jgi:hypothetical protein
MWSPEAKGHSLTENMSFFGFGAGLNHKNHPGVVSGIPVSGGLAAIFAELEPARLRHQARFAGKSPSYASLKSYPPTSVHHRGIRPESGSVYPQHIGFCRQTCQCWHLPRAFETACGPLGPEGRSLMENTPFGGFSAGLRRPNQLAAVGEFWFLVNWPLYLPTWIRWTSQLAAFCGQKVRLRLTLILRPYVRPSPRNGNSLQRSRSANYAALSAATVKQSLRKIKLK